jgi:prepilin-type N-terminal cleavage/methylation domain-containing protein
MTVRPGFTLIEVIIVLALLGLTAGLAVPALLSVLQPDGRHESVRAAHELLEAGRSLALERGTRVEIVIDSASGRYWVSAYDDSVHAITSGRIPLTDGARLELPQARARFVWDARGAAAADTLVIVTGESRTRLTVVPWTGAVVVP